jgi:hypothetical protein
MNSQVDLRSVKARLGDLLWLNFTDLSLPEAHRQLGQHVSHQVIKILDHRLTSLPSHRVIQLFEQARSCVRILDAKINDPHLDSQLRSAIAGYLDCLSAWSGGIGLASYDHPALAACEPLGHLDLALFLQHDSTGCQTGMLRSQDGSVTLWHTEEDIEYEPGSGFDQLRIASFAVDIAHKPVVMNAFIYPDLLPGPAFGWRSDGYAQAADLLYIKPFVPDTQACLANIVTWLALRLGPAYDLQALIEAMLPCFDGYALNTVFVREGVIQAIKCEFGASYAFSHRLGDEPGIYLCQANMFTDGSDLRIQEIEDLNPEERGWFESRIENTHCLMKARSAASADPGVMGSIFKMITSHAGGQWAFANQHVKAYFLCRLTPSAAELWLGSGPALEGDQPTVLVIPNHLL